jgi:hypothetical protein
MKTLIQYPLIVLLTAIITVSNLGCKKDNSDHTTVQLYDKPLDVIQKYLIGKWKFLYREGGAFNNPREYDSEDTYMTIDSNHIMYKTKTGIKIDSPITWRKEIYGGPQSYTYVLYYESSGGTPYLQLVVGIEDGVLTFRDFGSDPTTTCYRRSN